MGQRKKIFSNYSFIFACGLAFVGAAFAIGGLFVSKNNQVAQEALATDAVSYMAWDESSKSVKSVEGGCTDFTILDNTMTSLEDGKWYVVNSEVEINDRISVSGTANLILCDGSKLTAKKGLGLNDSANINIFAQSIGENAGILIAGGENISNNIAAIGGNDEKAAGNITIHGGKITATGRERAAGIGSGYYDTVGAITINGGVITATGGQYAVGIGAGNRATAGAITINGGAITATGGEAAAGIGSGYGATVGAITINGGAITATGGKYAAGIGGGNGESNCESIAINGGAITATGGENAAGIGGAEGGECGNITISNQVTSLTATKGSGAYDAIGRGNYGSYGTVTVCGVTNYISESPFTAQTITYNLNGGEFTGGFPGIYMTGAEVTLPTNITKENHTFIGWYDNLELTGDSVTAISSTDSGDKVFWAKWVENIPYYAWDEDSQTVKAVPGGCSEYTVLESNTTSWTDGWYVLNSNVSFDDFDEPITINGNDVNLILMDGCTLTVNSYIAVNSGNTLNIYSQSGGTGALNVTENERGSNAGIGGGYNGTGGNVTIHGGNITANGSHGAGIGGGYNGNGGNVTIYGGNITANGGSHGAGIGSGNSYNGNGGTVTVYGGNITANGGSEAAGIGGGHDADGGTVTVYGGNIIANGGEYGAGIGGGANGDEGTVNILGGTVVANGGSEAVGIGGGQGGAPGTLIIADSLNLFNPYLVEKVDDDYARSVNMAVTSAATVTFNTNGGTINSGAFNVYGEGIVTPLPTNVTRTNYSFGGWWDNATFAGEPVTEILPGDSGAKSYYARWYPVGYYLVGSVTDGKVVEDYLMTKNTAVTDTDEYYYEKKLTAGATIKAIHGTVVYGEDGSVDATYPTSGDSYTIPEDGFYRIYLRPNADGGDGWFQNTLLAKRLYTQVNGVNYHSLAEAYNVVSANGTIKLVDDLDLTGADSFEVTKNIKLDLNGFILDITTSGDAKIIAKSGAVITVKDTSETVGGVKGSFGVDVEKKSYISLEHCRLDISEPTVKADLVINRLASGSVVRNINAGNPDADGFISLVRTGTDQEFADDVTELIDAIGVVEPTVASKSLIDYARERYEALTSAQKELVPAEKYTALSKAESDYIDFVKSTINSIPAVGSIVLSDEPAIQNARTIYDALRSSEKTAFPVETYEKLTASETDIVDLKTAKAVEDMIDALPETILFEHDDAVNRASVRYNALTDYQKGKIPAAALSKLQAALTKMADWKAANFVISEINGLPASENIVIGNKSRIDSARNNYNALTQDQKDKVPGSVLDKLVAAEHAYAIVKADNDVADVVEVTISKIGKIERTEEFANKLANARSDYDALTEKQKALVENYSTLVFLENNYAQYLTHSNAVIDKINAIGTVENTEECKENIDKAREAFEGLYDEEKAFVTNYTTLENAEAAYAAYSETENVAKIGDVNYTDILTAFNAAKKGETVTLLKDVDLSDKVAGYITLRRDITIDLNGHVLNVATAPYSYVLWASDGATIRLDNSVPEKGGIKGMLGADNTTGAKYTLANCFLTLTKANIEERSASIAVAEGYVAKDLNNGRSSVNGYVSNVHIFGDRDYADDVDTLIRAIGKFEYTDACHGLIVAAREAYYLLTPEQKALVRYLSLLQDAEKQYASFVANDIETLIDDEITIADKYNIEKASAEFEGMTEAEKTYVPAATVTKLNDAKTALAEIMEHYTGDDDCTHSLANVTSTVTSKSEIKDYAYASDDAAYSSIGRRVNFPQIPNWTITPGNATITVTFELPTAQEVEVWWRFEYQGGYHTARATITHNSDSPIVYNLTDSSWKIDRYYCEAGTKVFTYRLDVDKTNWKEIPQGRNFYVVPKCISTFDENGICSLCGTKCLHERIGRFYDDLIDEYHFGCRDCHRKIDIATLPYEQEISFDLARQAYETLTVAQKNKFCSSDLFKLEAHEMLRNVQSTEEKNINDAKLAFKVSSLINGLPAVANVTLLHKDDIETARVAYDALTDAQKAYVTSDTLSILTNVETKYNQIKTAAENQEVTDVINLINSLPDLDNISFENRHLIEQARYAYNLLTDAQKTNVTNLTTLTNAEIRGERESWTDNITLEKGTYIFVSATDSTKAIINYDGSTIKVAYYNSETINNNFPDNRAFKWKTTIQGTDIYYSLENINDLSAANRLLDVASNGAALTENSALGLVNITTALSENDTNVFRFSKRKGVDMEDNEYFIRCVVTDQNKYDYVITLRDNNTTNMGYYVATNEKQIWKVIRVNGDDDFAMMVDDEIDALPDYSGTTLDNEAAAIHARNSYDALTDYQKGLVKNLAHLQAVEQKIVDLKAANAVRDQITAIGEVADTAASKTKIDTARTAYNSLTGAQKLLVTNYATLQAAEETCAGYVTSAINALPTPKDIVVSTDASLVTAARAKYTALTTEEAAYITQGTIDKLVASEWTITVKSLPPIAEKVPGVGELSLSDKPAVVAVRNVYDNDLSNNQKTIIGDVVLKILTDAETEIANLEAAQTVIDAINNIPGKEDIAATDATAVSNALDAYTGLTDYQKGKVSTALYNKLIASNVAVEILSLPALDDLGLDDYIDVVAARASYTALDDDQKALVSDTVLNTLTAAEKRMTDMAAAKVVYDLINEIGEVTYTEASHDKIVAARDGYNGLIADQKVFVTNYDILVAAEDTYSAAAEASINSDLKDIDVSTITIDDKDAIVKAKAKYDELTDEEKAKINQDTVDKVLTASLTIDIFEILGASDIDEEISTTDAKAIKDAKKFYDTLSVGQKEMLADSIVDKLLSSVAALNIIELPDGLAIQVTDKDAIKNARESYDILLPNQETLVPQTTLDKLVAAENILAVIDLPTISEIADGVTANEKKAILDAKSGYDALSDEQKNLVPNEVKDRLFASNATLAIVDIPAAANITSASEQIIQNARTTFDALSDDQEALVPEATLDKLIASEAVLKIVKLPAGADIKTTDETAIAAARQAFTDLSDDQEALIAQGTIDTLVAAETTLIIVKLPETSAVTASDAEAVAAARSAYNDITENQQALVPQSAKDKLIASEFILSIIGLPTVDEVISGVSDEVKNNVVNACDRYLKLTEAQQALVPDAAKNNLLASATIIYCDRILPAGDIDEDITPEAANDIKNAKKAYEALTDEQKALIPADSVDKIYTSEATLRIVEIPDIDKIDVSSAEAVNAAKQSFDGLTPEQKNMIPEAKKNVLAASIAVFDIVKLPAGADIKATDKAAIEAARQTYTDLSDDQEALVPQATLDTLVAAETTLQIVELPAGDSIKTTDSDAIKAARDVYDALDNAQKAKVDSTTIDTLVAAETTLQIVKLPTGTSITVNDKAAIEAARTVYDALSNDRKAKVAQATVDTLVAAEKTLQIVQLPSGTDIKATDATDIAAARTAYEALTADQKAKVAQATVDTLVAAETTLQIVKLPEITLISVDDKETIAAARSAYNKLTDAQKAKVAQETLDTLVASEMTLQIVELPAVSDVTSASGDVIRAARTAYDLLSDEQLDLVPYASRDKLIASESALAIAELPVGNDIKTTDADTIKAARDAYNALSDKQKGLVAQDTVDTLVAAETTLQIVKLPVGEAITANDSEAIVDARRAYSQLEDAQKEKVTQETLDTLRAAEITLYIVKLPVGNDISEDDATRIAGVRKAYNYATDAEKAKIAQATLDTLVAAETTLQIVELPEITLISVDDKEAIQAARTAYEALTADQKAKVTQETLDTLVASEMTLQIIELPAVSDVTSINGDVIRAARTAYDLLSDAQLELVPYASRDKLIASESALAIAELPVGNDIKATDKTAIEAAREQYEALSDKQKGLVAQDTVDTLVAAETTLQIVQLPAKTDITADSRDAIEKARAAVSDLSDEQLEKVTQETLDTLVAAETTLQIVELPATKDITPESRTAIVAARIAYEGLTSEQQAKVAQETLDTLIAAETALTIVELPDVTNISADSQEDIEAAREAYEELSDEQKKLVPQDTLDTLVAAETTLQIVELPATDDITSDSANDIAAAREAYDALTPEQKEKVSKATVDALTSSEATLSIVKLPVVGELTFDNKEDVIAVRNEYDALSDEGKANVPVDVVKKLVAAEVEIADIEAAKDTSEMIDSLPDVTNITREDREDVTSTRTSYDELSEYQQGKVSDETLAKLEEIEEVYTSMDKIDSIGTVAYTKDSKALIDDAKAYYDSLNAEQKVAIDNTNALNKAVTDYYAVDTAVNKADSITNIRHDARSDEAIKEARKEYESLSQDQKDLLPEESLQKIEDSETVYEALNKIYAIGNAEYTDESEMLIAEARKAYDELSEQQKAMVNKIDFAVLETAETSYANQENTANVTHITLIIIVSVLLGGGAILLALMVLSIFKAKKGLKAMSVAFVPAILATSHYLDSRFVALYVLAGVLLLVLIAIIVLWIKNPTVFKDMKNLFKKGEKMEMSPAPAVQAAPAIQPIPQPLLQEPVSDNEEEETVTVTDEKGNIFQIRFIKSFTAKLIQANEESKKYYEELKNYVLSYKKTASRVSWNYDSINSGRNPVLKFAIRGKTLGVYFPLNADDYEDSKYKVEKVESKKFEDVPCLYRIKNDRRCEYAKELIDVVMNNLGLEKGKEQKESYYLHYEENKPLIARGLIKELKVQVNKPVARETQILSVVTDEDGEEVVTKRDSKGNIFEIRYIKSFTAKLSQADDELKDYYNELKNYALSYKKANSRISWHFDSVNVGRNQVLKFVIRGKTLCLYYALNADDYAESKYKVEKVESKKYEDVPCLYRIKNDRRRDYAKDLIDVVMANVPTEKGKESNEDFRVPYETTEALLEKGLIKELKVQVNNPVSRETQILSVVTNADGDEVVTKQDRNGNIFEIRYIKSFTAKLSQAEQELKDYYNELKNYALGYKKANSRVSWHFDSINVGRNQVLKFAIRGKTLCLYFALNADDYADSKYKVEKVESKKFEDVPCLYRIKNDRRRDYAKDLIDTVMGNVPTEKGKESNEEFRVPFEETKVLLEKGLIKEVKTKVGTKEEEIQSITVEEADKQMSDEKAEASIEIDTVHKKRIGKKEIINIDTLSNSFNNGDEVTIEALIAKKLIPSKTGSVKLLARGTLNKKLTVCLNDYSLQAVKMIALLGGQVKIIK